MTAEPVPAEVVQVVDTWAFDLASPDPSGVTWLPATDRLLVVDSEVDEVTGAGHTAADLWELTRQGAVTRTGDTWAYSIEPTGVSWGDGVLFITDDNNKALYVVRPGNDGAFGTPDDPWTELSTGLSDMEDPAYDAATGVLYFLNGIDREVHWIDPGSDDTFGTGDDTRGQFDVHVHGVDDAEAMAFDPDRRTLLVGDRINERLFEITTDNQLVQVIDLSAAVSTGLQYVSGVTVAPHSSVAGASSYWVVDRGIDNSSSNLDENDGQLFEFARPSLTTPPTVTITEPEPWLNVLEGTPITFPATAVDVEDGTAPLAWRSYRDGALGTGTSIQATLSLGTHVVTATATDSDGQQGSDTITVYVTQPAGPWHVRRTVEASTDDAEQVLSSGSVTVTSSDLDLVEDRLSGSVMAPQRVGIRFRDVTVPAGAVVTAASVQFEAASSFSSTSVTLTITGEDVDDAASYTTASGSLTARPATTARVTWAPPTWTTAGDRGPAQRTPDLRAIVQEIVDRSGWSDGNAMALMVDGVGARVAASFDAGAGTPPTL